MRERQRSADGFEMTLAVNYLAPFVLSHVLLRAAGGASLARIVNVSSIAHGRGAIDHDDLSFERRGFDPYGTMPARLRRHPDRFASSFLQRFPATRRWAWLS